MRLILEDCINISPISEGEGKEKKLYLEGIFLQGEIQNKNGRRYPMDILEREVDKYHSDKIARAKAYGELGHPDTPTINPDRIAIHIKSLKREGTNYIGKALVASTPMGDIVKGLLSDGANLGVSSRGMGSMKLENNTMIIQDDYRLITAADIVTDPSGPNCYVNGIMEGVDWIYDERLGWKTQELVENQRKQIENQIKTLNEVEKIRLFRDFLVSLDTK